MRARYALIITRGYLHADLHNYGGRAWWDGVGCRGGAEKKKTIIHHDDRYPRFNSAREAFRGKKKKFKRIYVRKKKQPWF